MPTEDEIQVIEETDSPELSTDGGQPEEQLDAGSLMAELKRVRREAARYRTELRQHQQQAEEAKRAQLPEVDRLRADLATLQAQVAERDRAMAEQRLRSQIISSAAKLGFNDPEDAYRMLDLQEFTVENGTADGIDEGLAALRKAKPYLARQAGAPAVAPTNPAGQRTLTKADVAGMSADEINRRWDEVEKVLAQ